MIEARLEKARATFVPRSHDFWARRDSLSARVRHELGSIVWPPLLALTGPRQFADPDTAERRRAEVDRLLPELEPVSERLADEASRELLADLLAFHVLGPRHVRLPANHPGYWRLRSTVRGLRRARRTFRVGRHDLDLYQVQAPDGSSYRMHNAPYGVLLSTLLDHYEFDRDGVRIGVRPGDLVIDGGGCWGESALRFAAASGPDGCVLSYEFGEENLAVFRANLELNPELADRTEIVEAPLWSEATWLDREFTGPSIRVARGTEESGLRAVTVDAEVDRVGRSLGFLKLDVEGAEPDVLEGARRTLERDRPRLAISLYHSLSHLAEIPRWVSALDAGYEMYLDHPTIDAWETVLFCRPTG